MYATQTDLNTSARTAIALTGPCGYEIRNDRILISIGEIANHRAPDDISGTLAIELWALEQPYSGGSFNGTLLAGTPIGEIFGQHFLSSCQYDLLFQEPLAGKWHLALMLREWTAAGYLTRDHVNFALPYCVENKPTIIRREKDNVINVEFANNKKSPVIIADAPATPQSAAVSLSTASLEEIAAIKGISKKVAENIVAAQPFESIDEVLSVKGMGAKLLDKIRQFIRL